VLAGAAATALLAACDGGSEPSRRPTPSTTTGGAAEPSGGSDVTTAPTVAASDEALVAAALDDTRRLRAVYAALTDRHPGTRRVVAPLRAHLDEHLAALGDDGASTGARPTTVARSRPKALRSVRRSEQQASAARLADAVAAESGDLARVLAAMAAAHAQHALVLGAPAVEDEPVRDGGAGADGADGSDAAPDAGGDDPVVDALQAVLAGEHAAVYAYSVIGGRLPGDDPVVALSIDAYAVHRDRRDTLVAVLRAADRTPVAGEPGYQLPRPVEGPSSARELARLVEDRCSVLHAAVVATATGELRGLAADALVDCATRALAWGAEPTAFPGVGQP
jgi:hypothetical protein